MVDMDDEVAKFKWLLIGVIAFLISGYYSFSEVKFAIWGRTAEATVTRTYETTESGRRFRKRHYTVVEYQFAEADGTLRSERDKVSAGTVVPGISQIAVQYLPGVADSSRLAGQTSLTSICVFVGSLIWLSVAGYKLHMEANTPGYDSRRRRKK